ncbi:MAG: sigma-70 family RNA polymerase sigma factor [Bacteroidetes bacterium]|nr:sigma-70 family RNA polymerase sigma factor [Bacteroidota bacterium]
MDTNSSYSDNELITNIKTGRLMDESIKMVYRQYFGLLSSYVINNSGSQQDAEDIFQEVIVSFIDLVQRAKFRGESSVKTFLYSMNRNTWLNELKRRGRSEFRERKFELVRGDEEVDVSHFIADREAKNEVLSVVARLGEACKKILLLFYYENMGMKEILENTDYENEQVVRNKKYKCLKQLEHMINQNPALMNSLKNIFHG